VVEAAAFVGIGLAPGPVVVAALLAVQGFAVTVWNVVTISLRQRIVPAHLLGRVNSVYRMPGWGLMPLGALAGGFVAHAAGLRAPYIVAGLLCGLSVLAALPLLRAGERSLIRGALPADPEERRPEPEARDDHPDQTHRDDADHRPVLIRGGPQHRLHDDPAEESRRS
jgi:MFS family permease